MPTKLTKNELNKIQYVSMSDYYKNVNQYNTIEDKMKYTTRYLLNHKGHEDYSLVEAIHIARQAIGNSLEKSNEKDNLEANMFVANPIEYIRKEAVKLASEIDQEENTLKKEDDLKASCQYIGSFSSKANMVQKLSHLCDDRAFPLKAQFVIKCGGRKALENIKNDTKPGFFSRLFGTTSKEWKNLESAYNEFSKRGSRTYGDKTIIKNASIDYLKHKFPNYQESQEITKEMIDRLDKTSKAKTIFALNLLNSVKDQQEIDRNYTQALARATDKNVLYEDIVEARKNKVIDLDQNDFQNDLQKETEENIIESPKEEKNLRYKTFKELGSIEAVSQKVREIEEKEKGNEEMSLDE